MNLLRNARLVFVGTVLAFAFALALGRSLSAAAAATNAEGPAGDVGRAADAEAQRIARALDAIHAPRPIDNTDTWLVAVRDLVAVGRPAVPVLAAELEKTDRAFEQSVIPLTLRAIGDRRAVPVLIDALGRCRVGVSDFGLSAVDPELHLLLGRLQIRERWESPYGSVGFGRPVREITATLEALTGHSEGSAHLRMYDADGSWPKKQGPEHSERERQLIRVVAERWRAWWEANRGELLAGGDLAWANAHTPRPFGEAPREGARTLTVTVSGDPDGKPLARLPLQVWVDHASYIAKTDAAGSARLALPASFYRVAILAHPDGLVPGMLAWGEKETLPDRAELRLPRGVPIGGVVQDDAGKPVEAARVFLLAPQKLGDHAWADLLDAPAMADAAGRWRIDNVPAGLAAFALRTEHPAFVNDAPGYDRAPKVPLNELKDLSARLTLHPAYALRGRVLDADGKPVPGARVAVQGTQPGSSDYPDQTTDADGRFKWPAMPPGALVLAAQAEGHGPALLKPSVGPDTGELEVRLPAGHLLQGRVTDPQGQPVAEAQVVLLNWQGRKLIEWSARTSVTGQFFWPDAPADKVLLGVYRTGFETAQAVVDPAANPGQVAVKLQPCLRIEGTVVDAESGEPIDHFSVMPGLVHGDPPVPFVHRQEAKPGTGGHFEYQFRQSHDPRLRERGANDQVVRVEAAGYVPVISRPLGWREGTQRIEFRLTRGTDVTGRVVSAEGKPLAGADVIMATPSCEAYVYNGSISESNRREGRNLATTSGADGGFSFPPQFEPFKLVVLHEAGWAEVTREQLAAAGAAGAGAAEQVKVTPWGRVEGKLLIENHPADDKSVSLRVAASRRYQPGALNVQYSQYVQTDGDGRFTFKRVQPGEYRLASSVPINPTVSTTTPGIPVTVQSGKTVTAQLGGEGRRPVIGRITAPGIDAGAIDWTKATLRLLRTSPRGDPVGEPIKEIALAADGTFRLEDVAAGVAAVSCDFELPPLARDGEARPRSGRITSRFEVPGGPGDEPLDLGAIPLSVSTELAVGQAAPPFRVRTLDGKAMSLADFKGKYVLLDFWATWCGPCVAEIPDLKAVYDAFGKDPRFAMVSLDMDSEPQRVKGFVEQREMNWSHGFIGDWSASEVPGLYGVNGIPAVFLISPEGKVIAKDLRGERTRKAVADALGAQP